MLSNLSIGKRMGLAFATLVCLALALAASGYWGLSNVTATAETSGEVQAATLNLRRYEKDYFLNIAEAPVRAEYLAKWKAEYQDVIEQLDKLHALLRTDAERSKVA